MKFEQALRAMRRGETVKRKGTSAIKFWIDGKHVTEQNPMRCVPSKSLDVIFSMSHLVNDQDWVIVRKKKRPDKPAPKVYTEDELEPVGTVPVVGDRYVVAYVPSGQDAYKVGQLFTAKSTTVEGVDSWSHFCFDHSGDEQIMRFRILKRPLRDVFKDPRVGDVVRLGFEVNKPYKILHVDENYVFAEDGLATWWFRAGWASLATSNHTVISRAESK